MNINFALIWYWNVELFGSKLHHPAGNFCETFIVCFFFPESVDDIFYSSYCFQRAVSYLTDLENRSSRIVIILDWICRLWLRDSCGDELISFSAWMIWNLFCLQRPLIVFFLVLSLFLSRFRVWVCRQTDLVLNLCSAILLAMNKWL